MQNRCCQFLPSNHSLCDVAWRFSSLLFVIRWWLTCFVKICCSFLLLIQAFACFCWLLYHCLYIYIKLKLVLLYLGWYDCSCDINRHAFFLSFIMYLWIVSLVCMHVFVIMFVMMWVLASYLGMDWKGVLSLFCYPRIQIESINKLFFFIKKIWCLLNRVMVSLLISNGYSEIGWRVCRSFKLPSRD